MLSAIWYHWYNLKKRGKHPSRCVNFGKVANKSNTPLWVYFTFFKL